MHSSLNASFKIDHIQFPKVISLNWVYRIIIVCFFKNLTKLRAIFNAPLTRFLPLRPNLANTDQIKVRVQIYQIQHLALQHAGATELMEEGPVIYMGSYYISQETCVRQEQNRALRFNRNYETWAQQVQDAWRDHFDFRSPMETSVDRDGMSSTGHFKIFGIE